MSDKILTVPQGRVLTVDDEPAVLKLLEKILAPAGYQVISCDSGAEALKLLSLTSFDCVVTDAMMPAMNGFDLTKAVRRHPVISELPIIMLTRKRARTDVQRAVDAGVTDYVLKPIDEHLLLEKVELAVKKGEGKRHIFEVPVTGIEANTVFNFEGRMLSISEADITLKSPVELPEDLTFTISSRIFDQIGIAVPILKVFKNEKMVETSPISDSRQTVYKVKVAFVGMTETDLMKIRSWAQKELARQRR